MFYFLVSWGLPAFINGLSVFNKFKPSTTTEKIAVEDAAIAPPILNIPFESTSSAMLVVSGYAVAGSKVEIYLDDQLQNVNQTKEDGSFSSDPIELVQGTNNIYGKTVLDESSNESTPKKSLPSKNIKVYYSSEKPKLEIFEPEDNKTIQGGDKKVKVSGKTDPENTITINGNTVIVNFEGKFSSEVSLNDGENNILVIVYNRVGNSTKIERKITYTP